MKDVDSYKLCYPGSVKHRHEIGILVDKQLSGKVVEVKRIEDRLMMIKLVIRGSTLNIISSYALQAVLDEEEQHRFLEVLYEVVRGVPSTEKLFIEGDFNEHIMYLLGNYDDVHGGLDFGDKNE